MDASKESQAPPKESFARALICRLLGIVSVLSLWHIPDLWAAAIYAVGVIIFYYPHRAVTEAKPPPWLMALWFGVIGAVVAAYFWVEAPAPAGSLFRPAAKYGLLAIVIMQVLFDLVRRGEAQNKKTQSVVGGPEGAAGA